MSIVILLLYTVFVLYLTLNKSEFEYVHLRKGGNAQKAKRFFIIAWAICIIAWLSEIWSLLH